MANIPNSSKYKTTSKSHSRRTSSPANYNNGGGISLLGWSLLIIAGLAIIIKYPIVVIGGIVLCILCQK